MDNPPAFDLNRGIHDWRTGLSKTSALQRDSLDELESHLRDSITTLSEKGLSEEEALLVAVRRCGTELQLQTEFSKSGLIEIWFFRGTWILFGFLILLNGYSLVFSYPDPSPVLYLFLLAVTGLNTLQLRYLATARLQHSILSALYWFVTLLFSGSLILASGSTFEILATYLSRNARSPYTSNFWWDYGFAGIQVLMLVLLLVRSGMSARLRISGSLILASCATLEILVAYFSRNATSPYMSRNYWCAAFAGLEIFILVLLLALSAMFSYLRLRFFEAHRT